MSSLRILLNTGIIHTAGGNMFFENIDGVKKYNYLPGRPYENYYNIKNELKRGPTEMLETHVLLAKTEIFNIIGKFDEEIYSFGDHADLIINVQNKRWRCSL